ncbi:MAG TPA: methyltransferase domain-containing protein [Nitrospiria bacterium]|nr:methyltransferase domain-containing protein [Nitrospiria bacterium]
MSVNEAKLHEFLGKMVTELGAAANATLVLVGDKLGLYRAIAEAGSVSSRELAERTGTSERYVREWLSAQAASGYVDYDKEKERFSLSPEQKLAFADENSPVLLTGGFYSIASIFADEPKLTEAFKTGKGIAWGDHNGCLFCGVEKFFRPSYKAHLIQDWIPAIGDAEEKLKRGAQVADVGCGHGVSTLTMAEAYPNSFFVGFDYHPESIEHARKIAKDAGLKNVSFEVATAKDYPGEGYDLVTFFDCLHDMGDPAGAAAHVRETLSPDGSWMIVEPFAGDTLEENLNPVGRVYYAFSTAICTPSSLSQEVGAAIGAQAGEKRIGEAVKTGGFSRFRRATETPFNLVLHAQP